MTNIHKFNLQNLDSIICSRLSGCHSCAVNVTEIDLQFWNMVFNWNDENFGKENWLFKDYYFIFTTNDDLVLFKLRWC